MTSDLRDKCILAMYETYPLCRRLIYEIFDKKKYELTRTQQIIMLSLSISGVLTMSQLAKKINTSNEQATRAVAQLVDKGFIVRLHNPDNRRVVNIKLTDEAQDFMNKTINEIKDELIKRFEIISDDEMEKTFEALEQLNSVLRRVLK